jgi:hypothetical protein
MLKSILASFFLIAIGIAGASADEQSRDPSTWRWAATKAIEAQRRPESSMLAEQSEFTQRYERYSFNGQIEGSR